MENDYNDNTIYQDCHSHLLFSGEQTHQYIHQETIKDGGFAAEKYGWLFMS
jgi:hypothetical protein